MSTRCTVLAGDNDRPSKLTMLAASGVPRPIRILLYTKTRSKRRLAEFKQQLRKQFGPMAVITDFGGAAGGRPGLRTDGQIQDRLFYGLAEVVAVEYLSLLTAGPRGFCYFLQDIHEAGAELISLDGGFDSTKSPVEWNEIGSWVASGEEWTEYWDQLPFEFQEILQDYIDDELQEHPECTLCVG